MDNCEVLSCFDSYVGVKGCHNETTCKFLVNDLTGMSTELLDKISDNERETYFDVFTKSKTMAINSLRDDVLEVLLRDKVRYKFENTLFETEKARIIKPIEVLVSDKDFVGTLLTTANSKYILAHVNSISFYPTAAGIVYAKIVDYETNEVLFSTGEAAIEIVPNQINKIVLDYNIDCSESRALIVVLQRAGLSADFSLAKLSCNRFKEKDCSSCDLCECLDCSGNATAGVIHHELLGLDQVNEFALYNFKTDSLTDLSVFDSIENYISVDMGLICSIDQFICENAQRLSGALIYKIGANLMSEKLGGYRVNNFAKGGLEFTRDNKEYLQKEYQKRIDKIVPSLPLSGDSMCWACDKEVGVYIDSKI